MWKGGPDWQGFSDLVISIDRIDAEKSELKKIVDILQETEGKAFVSEFCWYVGCG